ncbi:MAG: nuclear transport factor 2 family protein [Acidimicrobiia bacterium]
MELWEVIARESIRDLVTRYNSNGDTGRFPQMIECFAPDAVMEIGEPDDKTTYRGTGEIINIFTGAKANWNTELSGDVPAGEKPKHYIRHRIATHQIDFVDQTHARGRCYYSVIMPHGLDHWGRYFDEYEERDGRWLFTYRRVTTEGRTPR